MCDLEYGSYFRQDAGLAAEPRPTLTMDVQGDDYVDWVGMSIYHWGVSYPYTQNVLPEARKLTSTVSQMMARSPTGHTFAAARHC